MTSYKTSTWLTRLTAVALAGCFGVGLTACGVGPWATPAPQPARNGALAIIVGAHANTVAPSVTEAVRSELAAAIDTESTGTVIVADGAPKVTKVVKLQATGENQWVRDRAKAAALAEVRRSIETVRAAVPEVDALAALDTGARAVADAPGDKRIVVIDSGLSTSGALRMQDGVLASHPRDTVDKLERAHQLPRLHGVTVTLIGLGETRSPQESLRRPDRETLVETWTELIQRGGGTPRLIQAPPLDRALSGELPHVTVVDVPRPVSFPQDPRALPPIADSEIGFRPDSAAFRDPQLAVEVLAPYAQTINDSGARMRLTGTCANVGDHAGQRALSETRAAAVRDLLVAHLRVPADRVEARGVGSAFPGYLADRDSATGVLDPVRAAANRKVIVEPIS
ncbi:OmpA family protein [Saccharopolyspora sp. NPDC003752]